MRNDADTPEQVLKFVPKEQPGSYGLPADEAGQAIIAKIQKAADLSNENCDRAMKLAHKLSMQLRAAEDRVNQLEAEVELLRDRAVRAEARTPRTHLAAAKKEKYTRRAARPRRPPREC